MSEPYEYEEQQAYEDFVNKILKEYGDELFDEHYDEAVQQFTDERLKSYYLKNPALARPAIEMFDEAVALKQGHPKAAFLFFMIATEITVNKLLVRPIVNGLVHNEAVADIVVKLTPYTGSENFKDLFFDILSKLVGIDMTNYRRDGSKLSLWNEWKGLQKERNFLVHGGANPTADGLSLSELVALELLRVLYPKVLGKLGLKVNGYLLIEG
jgi:hypothetical protein